MSPLKNCASIRIFMKQILVLGSTIKIHYLKCEKKWEEEDGGRRQRKDRRVRDPRTNGPGQVAETSGRWAATPPTPAAAPAPRRGWRRAAGLTLPRGAAPESVETHRAIGSVFRPTPHTARSSCHPPRSSLCLSTQQRHESETVPNTALEPRGRSADTSGTAARTASSFSSAADLVKAVLRYLLLNKGILFSV